MYGYSTSSFHNKSHFHISCVFIQVSDHSERVNYTAAAFHPDGLILGTGTSQSVVKIWDVKSQVKNSGLRDSIASLKNQYLCAQDFIFFF